MGNTTSRPPTISQIRSDDVVGATVIITVRELDWFTRSRPQCLQ